MSVLFRGCSVLLVALCLTAPAPCLAESARLDQLIERVNAFRVEAGLKPLRVEPRLMAAAQAHAETMAASGCVKHTCADGIDLVERLEQAGYPYRVAAENLAAGYPNGEQVAEDWLKSERHRRNMLNPQVSEVGAGYALAEPEQDLLAFGHYWTLALGAQRILPRSEDIP